MKLLQVLCRILWIGGCVGSGILTVSVEWDYLRMSSTQIFNPLVHLQVVGTLLTIPSFWIFLWMICLGYYGERLAEKYIRHNQKLRQSKRKEMIDGLESNFKDDLTNKSSRQRDNNLLKRPQSLSNNPQNKIDSISSSPLPKDPQNSHVDKHQEENLSPKTQVSPASPSAKADCAKPVHQQNIAKPLEVEQKNLCPEANFDQLQRTAYSNWSNTEVLDVIHQELAVIPDQRSKKLHDTIGWWLEKMRRRPHQGADFYELQRITYDNWNNVEILCEVHHELRFLSRQKGHILCDKIARQVGQLQVENFIRNAFSEHCWGENSLSIQTKPVQISPKSPIRTYFNHKLNELRDITDKSWDDAKILGAVCNELAFRTSRKSQDLRGQVIKRLTQLQNKQFPWPTTIAISGLHNLPNGVFKHKKGLLKRYGYKVGESGLSAQQRRQVLDSIFRRPLFFAGDKVYLNDWGQPSTSKRLQKMANSIAAFTRNEKRRRGDTSATAVQNWESDLEYLKRTYYEGHFHFQWPSTGTSKVSC